MVDRRIVGLILPADAEAHGRSDLVGESAERTLDLELAVAEVWEDEIGADRSVAARDVEPDADDGHLFTVRRASADRHHVAHVPIRHERCVGGARSDVLELCEGRRIVRSKDLHRESGSGLREWQHTRHPEKTKTSGATRGLFDSLFPIPDYRSRLPRTDGTSLTAPHAFTAMRSARYVTRISPPAPRVHRPSSGIGFLRRRRVLVELRSSVGTRQMPIRAGFLPIARRRPNP